MQVLFDELARAELRDAVTYYELEHEGLGSKFKSEVRQAISRIQQFPTAWPVERGEIRRYLLHKFPYKLLYSIESEHIYIIAIAHQHRRPYYWINRIL